MWKACVALVGVLFMAGCAEVATPAATVSPSVAPPATVSEATGALEGIVVDEESLPIADVEVAILRSAWRTRTDLEGRYSISEIEPGTHEIVFGRLGYAQVARRIDVVPGQVASLNVTMKGIELVPVPYVESFSRVGFIDAGTGNLHSQVFWKINQSCSACKHPLVFEAGVQQVMLEYVFKPTIDYPNREERIYYSMYRNTTDNGPSPLTHEYIISGWLVDHGKLILVSPTQIKPGPNKITLYMGGDSEPYLTYQQRVEAWFSAAFHGPLPDNWTAAPPKQ